MAETVLAEYTIPLQMIFLEAVGVDTVRANPRTQRDPIFALQRAYTLGCDGFVQVLKHFRICPDLLARAQGIQVFKSLCKLHPTKMEVTDFMAALGRCALLIFSGPEWDAQYPTEGQKMRLLLLWMDKNSRLFQGNGRKLCKSASSPQLLPSTSQGAIDRWRALPHYPRLDMALREVFGFYCNGDADSITSLSFLRFIRDAGLCTDANLRHADIDVIFHQLRGHHSTSPVPQTLQYDDFYAALGVVATRLYTSVGESAQCFLRLVQDYILPAMAHIYHAHLPPDNLHTTWRHRWRELCELKDELASPQVQRLFDAPPVAAPSSSRACPRRPSPRNHRGPPASHDVEAKTFADPPPLATCPSEMLLRAKLHEALTSPIKSEADDAPDLNERSPQALSSPVASPTDATTWAAPRSQPAPTELQKRSRPLVIDTKQCAPPTPQACHVGTDRTSSTNNVASMETCHPAQVAPLDKLSSRPPPSVRSPHSEVSRVSSPMLKDIERHVLEELCQLSHHLRSKLASPSKPVAVPSHSKSAQRLSTAIEQLSHQLAKMSSTHQQQHRRHPQSIPLQRAIATTQRQTQTRARQCTPHTLRDRSISSK